MRQTIFFILSTLALSVGFSCNNKEPYIIEYKNLKGYVIGRETCNIDMTKDYWLIDFTYGTNNLQAGDTLVLNGITYTNVLKTKDLDQLLKTIGPKVSIDYINISSVKITTTGCDVSTPSTYQLKEVTIQNQFEIR
jgi:hypothetical protein